MLDRAVNQTSGLQAPSPIRTGFQRRKPSGGGGGGGGGGRGSGGGGAKSSVAGVGTVSGNGYAGNWQNGASGNAPYSADWWTELEAVLANSSDTSVVFIASETFANLSSVVSDAAELDAASWDAVEYVEYVTAGPLNNRLVVARAEVTFLDNVTYDVIIEHSQQYNFSVVSDTELTFIVPPWMQEITDDDGYANVTVSTTDGPTTLLSLNLYYTEDCPRRGWFGSGLSCRPCLQGGYESEK
jgi:hypothetical protein